MGLSMTSDIGKPWIRVGVLTVERDDLADTLNDGGRRLRGNSITYLTAGGTIFDREPNLDDLVIGEGAIDLGQDSLARFRDDRDDGMELMGDRA